MDRYLGQVALVMLSYGVVPEVWMHWTMDTIERLMSARRHARDARAESIRQAASAAAAHKSSLAVRYVVPLTEADYGG